MNHNLDKVYGLRGLLLDICKGIHCGEGQVLSFLEKNSDRVLDSKLNEILEHHRRETVKHRKRIESILTMLNEEPSEGLCKGMDGIILGTEELLERCQTPEIRDAAIIERLQHIIHYEIATYGTAVAYSKMLGLDAAIPLLLETLNDEKNTDEELSLLAVDTVNLEAR